MEVKKHKDINPLAMRILFGEKSSLSEIRDVIEWGGMAEAHRKGWLKCVLGDDDYGMPELIDPDG